MRQRLGMTLVIACLAIGAMGVVGCRSEGVVGESGARYNAGSNGVAIDGYDVVAYHTERLAVLGNADHEVVYDGVVWRFATAANQARFETNPAAYVPAYGGWCAYAMAQGDYYAIDPDEFIVTDDGRLFLFFPGTKSPWEDNPDTLENQADEHWADLVRWMNTEPRGAEPRASDRGPINSG